jgi:hypothetical protein
MKLACSSGALAASFVRGDLTQLEFLDLCAHEFACDGVVFDVRHFPRTDDDYLAQLKKTAADRGLSVVALAGASVFESGGDAMDALLRYALAIGAPLVCGSLARDVDFTWTQQLEHLNEATSRAKAANVTLALRNAPGTFAASTHDCKRVVKETDSAWLRFGPEPRAFDAASDPAELAANSVLLWSNVGDETERSVGDVIRGFVAFRGHLVLDEPSGDASIADVRAAVRSWRIALASLELNRT